MSNVDRYRPAREGYQPPSLPLKPPPTIGDRLSKSPAARRRDVPPAVPSPPAYSSRTSPPRPQSARRSAPSPANSSPQRLPQARPDQWTFALDEVASTPSILDGLSVTEERVRRSKGVNFIYQTGISLDIPQTTLWVAGVFFHRFYMRHSMVEEKGGIHQYNIAATSLFLANKTEENCRKTKDLIIAVAKVAQKNPRLVIDEQSKEYWRWRDSILAYEELMLEVLTFDLVVDNPFRHLYEQLGHLDMIHDKALRNSAWAFCGDAAMTILPIVVHPRDVAITAIFFASTMTKIQLHDRHGEAWWKFLRGSEDTIVLILGTVMDWYKENPLRKTARPGSPEFNLESTRRRGETIVSQTEAGSPIDVERGAAASVSPLPPRRGVANGNAGGRDGGKGDEGGETGAKIKIEATDGDMKMENTAAAPAGSSQQPSRGDSDAALKAAANDPATHEGTHPPNGAGAESGGGVRTLAAAAAAAAIKHRSMDVDDSQGGAGSDEQRESKRPRLSSPATASAGDDDDDDDDDDEGEVDEGEIDGSQ
ncbi:cyclin-like protein [Bombardia bombarda]|uniref:RNA polymerase II holoenzyme cyclin-like subunit n=1 Tax=Bombardia bombarda TaxID=252184 RepID=A0AA39WMQ7_9PEZI|nr:cyclin-like protein [Bombardia bombarda]